MGAEQAKLTSEQKREYLETFRRLCLPFPLPHNALSSAP